MPAHPLQKHTDSAVNSFHLGAVSRRVLLPDWHTVADRKFPQPGSDINWPYPVTLSPIDYAILALYFAFVLGIGWVAKKRVATCDDFLTSCQSVPVWITSLAFIAANLGAQEVIGMCASGAKYGIMTAHFYWVGAIPAMLFVGVFMMPFYYGSRARSVPEYLKLRFDEKTRASTRSLSPE